MNIVVTGLDIPGEVRYRVEWRVAGETAWPAANVINTYNGSYDSLCFGPTSVTIAGLFGWERYEVRACAVTLGGLEGAWSGALAIETDAIAVFNPSAQWIRTGSGIDSFGGATCVDVGCLRLTGLAFPSGNNSIRLDVSVQSIGWTYYLDTIGNFSRWESTSRNYTGTSSVASYTTTSMDVLGNTYLSDAEKNIYGQCNTATERTSHVQGTADVTATITNRYGETKTYSKKGIQIPEYQFQR